MPTVSRLTNILLVDDDRSEVESVQRAFAKANIHDPLVVAASGAEALEILRGPPVPRRLVLLDLKMPILDGLETLRLIRQDPQLSSVTVVVLSSSHKEQDRVAAFALHAAGYLFKPDDAEDYVEMMVRLVRYWENVELL